MLLEMNTALMLVVTCFTATVEANTEVRVTQSDTPSNTCYTH